MRPGQNKRMRGRNNNNSNNRRGPNPLTRSYESNGPDVKIRGTAHHVGEKYLQLARDAQSSGDPVMAESYLQHAEHYFRLIAAAQAAQQQAQFGYQRAPGEQADPDDDSDDDFDALPDRFASPADRGGQNQPYASQPYEQRNDRGQGERQPYDNRNQGGNQGQNGGGQPHNGQPQHQHGQGQQGASQNGQHQNGQSAQPVAGNQNGHYADRPQHNDRQDRQRQPYQERQDRQDRGGQHERGQQERFGQNQNGREDRLPRDYDNRNFRNRRDGQPRDFRDPPREARPPVPDEQPSVGLPAFITAPSRVVAEPEGDDQPMIASASPATAPEGEDGSFHMRPRRRRRPKAEFAEGVDHEGGSAEPAPSGEPQD